MSNSLIQRLSEAAGPDRELDHWIQAALNRQRILGTYKRLDHWVERALKNRWATPAYTASLDAALTLVPEGCDWLFTGSRSGDLTESPGKPFYGAILEKPTSSKPVGDGKSRANAAIALCIAALRARGLE